MSAKVQPFDSGASAGSGKYRARGSFDGASEGHEMATKSPRSPRVGGKLSRQNSFGDTRSISRQNSLGGTGSTKNRRVLDDGEGADIITDHSGASSARGPHSSRSSKHKSRKHNSVSSKSGKKRVSFSTPLVDPRPEKMLDNSATYGGDNSLSEEEFAALQGNESSDPITPRRMKKRRRGIQGRWRRLIPFGQYIPTLPSFFCSIFGSRPTYID